MVTDHLGVSPLVYSAAAYGYHGFMRNSEEKAGQTPSRARVYWLFGLFTLSAALGNLSQTGLNAMLPVAMAEFGVQVDVGQWLTTGYMLVLGIAVPVATYLMQRMSDRVYLLLCLTLFASGSFVDVVAPGFAVMLVGRVLQACAVGLLIPKNQTIAMTRFEPGTQATAMGVAGIALGFAPNIGPTVGGAMDAAFGWRSFFVLLLAVTLVLAVLASIMVDRGEGRHTGMRFEAVSFAFSTLGFGGVLLGLSQASSFGLASTWVWVPMEVGVVFLLLFLRRQRRVDSPLMDLRIFESSKFTGGLLASVFLFACYMGVTLVIPLYVTGVQGGSSLDAGLILLPATFTALIVNPLAGVLSDKTSPRLAALVFASFLTVGAVACTTVGEHTPFWLLSVYQTTRAIGVSGLIGPLLTYSLSGLHGPLVGHGSSASVIIRQVAATFGTAIMVFCVAATRAAVGMTSALPYQVAMAFSAVMALLCLGTVIVRVK